WMIHETRADLVHGLEDLRAFRPFRDLFRAGSGVTAIQGKIGFQWICGVDHDLAGKIAAIADGAFGPGPGCAKHDDVRLARSISGRWDFGFGLGVLQRSRLFVLWFSDAVNNLVPFLAPAAAKGCADVPCSNDCNLHTDIPSPRAW